MSKQKFLENILSHALLEETKGEKTTPELKKFYEGFPVPQADETPWCSLFLYWCAKEAGISTLPEKSKAPMARSWLKVGMDSSNIPEPGDVVVLSRGDNPVSGHVGIFCRLDGDKVVLLGGNQGDRVSFERFGRTRIVGIRRL